MTAFTPRVSGAGDSGDDSPGGPAGRRSDRPRPVDDAEGPAAGPWENVGGRTDEPVWPDIARPDREGPAGRRRAVSAIREVPVDAEVVDLAEREQLVAPAPVEELGARVIDIRDDVQRRGRESRADVAGQVGVAGEVAADPEHQPTADADRMTDARLDGYPPSGDAAAPGPDSAELDWGPPPAQAPPAASPPPSRRRRQSVTSHQQPQPPFVDGPLHPVPPVAPGIDVAVPRRDRPAAGGRDTPPAAGGRDTPPSAVQARRGDLPSGGPGMSDAAPTDHESPFAGISAADESPFGGAPAVGPSLFGRDPAVADPLSGAAPVDGPSLFGRDPAVADPLSGAAPVVGPSLFGRSPETEASPFGPVGDAGQTGQVAKPVGRRQNPAGTQSPVTGSVLPPKAPDAAAEPPFDSAEPPFDSAEPPFDGAEPPFDGAEPSFDGAEPRGASRAWRGRVTEVATAANVEDVAESGIPARPSARHRAVTTPSSVNRRIRQAAVAAAGLSVLIVLLLWAAAGGLADLSSPALAIGSLSRLAGLLGTDLLLIQVLLMARVPALERAFGRAVLTRWHTLAGLVSFGLIVAHIALSVSGTAILERFNIFEAAWRLVSTTAGLPLAVLATALLVLVALSSRREARHRRRDTRHMLTLYAYAGLLLALPHQLLAGTSLTDSPLAALYWWALFLGASAALVVFRLGMPLFRSFRHQLVVDEVSSQVPGVVTISLRGRQLRHLGARAGEFFHWRFLDGAGWHRALVSPLSAVPTGDRLQITMASAEGDERLESLSPGTWVLFEGPYGSLTADARTRAKIAFFTSGLGIAPVRALLEDLDYGRDDAVLVYRLLDEPALFADELDAVSKRRGAEVVYLDGPSPEDRESWLPAAAAAQIGDDAAVTHLVPDIADRDVYVSGPEDWTATMLDALRGAGVPQSQVHSEVFSA